MCRPEGWEMRKAKEGMLAVYSEEPGGMGGPNRMCGFRVIVEVLGEGC